jgi:hypothetical protein
MKTVYADFNAMTEADQVRLTTRRSQQEVDQRGIRAGDCLWLTDGELVVGARVAVDPRYGIVGVPAWDTMVNLENADQADFAESWARFQELSRSQSRSPEDETTILQLLQVFERKAPPAVRSAAAPGYFSFRRAVALWSLGHLELGLEEIEQALAENPDRENYIVLHLEFLRRLDLNRAVREARQLMESHSTTPSLMAACINVFATFLDTLSDDDFRVHVLTMLHWIERFERGPGPDNARPTELSQFWFNKGMVLLRHANIASARDSFLRGLQMSPANEILQQAARLNAYDDEARRLSARFRTLPHLAA